MKSGNYMRLSGYERVEELALEDLSRLGVGLAVNAARLIPPRRNFIADRGVSDEWQKDAW